MSKSSVWALTYGEYSDYGVRAIYATQEDAEAVAKQLGGDYDVEEMDLYAEGDRSLRNHYVYTAQAIISGEGVIGNVECWEDRSVSDDDGPYLGPDQIVTYYGYSWQCTLRGTDRDRLIKTVSERAAMVAQEIVEGRDPLQLVHEGHSVKE